MFKKWSTIISRQQRNHAAIVTVDSSALSLPKVGSHSSCAVFSYEKSRTKQYINLIALFKGRRTSSKNELILHTIYISHNRQNIEIDQFRALLLHITSLVFDGHRSSYLLVRACAHGLRQ